MKCPKTLIRIGFVLLVVVAVLLVVRAVFDYVEGRALIRTLAGLKEKGVPLTAADLAAPCPDEDNGARLWKAAENLLVIEEPPKRPQITPLDVRATGWSALPGAFMKYAQGGPVDPAQRADLQDLASRNVRVFELMSEAGAKPCFLSRDPAASAIESLTPGSISAIKMLRATQLLGFSALFAAEAGDVPGALDRLRAGLKFAPRAAEDGTLIMYLVAVAGTRGLTYFLQDICGDGRSATRTWSDSSRCSTRRPGANGWPPRSAGKGLSSSKPASVPGGGVSRSSSSCSASRPSSRTSASGSSVPC